MKQTTCGIAIIDPSKQWILLGHITRSPWWDIPKGLLEETETPIQAAVRETFEETGIIVDPQQLREVGLLPYNPKKNLHLFVLHVDSSSIVCRDCVCTSFFTNLREETLPEIDDFSWYTYNEAQHKLTNSMQKTLIAYNIIHITHTP